MFEREVRTLAHLNHPYIVKFMCCGTRTRTCFIGMELVQMHFSELIKVRGEDPKPLPRDSTCMTSGMHMHRDLKTPNEVVNKLHTPHLVENLCVKLTDFGLSKTN